MGFEPWIRELPGLTHIVRKVKYHCTADLLFYRFRFNLTSQSVVNFNIRNATELYRDTSPYDVSE